LSSPFDKYFFTFKPAYPSYLFKPPKPLLPKLGDGKSAKCIDCHLPHPFVRKYIGKMQSGLIDAYGFTFQNFKEPIMIKERTKKILQENCLRCHKGIFEFPDRMGITSPEGVDCIHCHSGVAHGQRASIGAPLKKMEESNE
jgi:nitrate/TMAO reductase-like tetraheme cytochrome c subunit